MVCYGAVIPSKMDLPNWHNLPNTAKWNLSNWKGPSHVDPSSRKWRGTIAICSIMKNEHHSDVVEWLLYNKCETWTL